MLSPIINGRRDTSVTGTGLFRTSHTQTKKLAIQKMRKNLLSRHVSVTTTCYDKNMNRDFNPAAIQKDSVQYWNPVRKSKEDDTHAAGTA
jgi:hypothetical protein